MAELIFAYRMENAWQLPVTELKVFDCARDNVSFGLFFPAAYPLKQMPKTGMLTVSVECIEAIRAVIEENLELFEHEKVDTNALVIDGVKNCFAFCYAGCSHCVSGWCLSVVLRNRSEKTKSAELLVHVFLQIAELLKQAGVDERYLQLDWNENLHG